MYIVKILLTAYTMRIKSQSYYIAWGTSHRGRAHAGLQTNMNSSLSFG